MSGSGKGSQLRAAAAEVVDSVAHHGRSLDTALANAEPSVAADDRALLRLLSYGTLRQHFRLSEWIGQLVPRPFKSRDRIVHSLLAVGIYQLSDTRIPDHAAVSATVDAARVLRRPKLAALTNAVLRRALRDRIFDAAPSDPVAKYDHPAWLLEELRRDWPNDWEQIVDANNDRAPMWLRVNPVAGSAADYQALLQRQEIEADLWPPASQALRLREACSVDELPGFAEGKVSVQDAAAQLAAAFLSSNNPARVLDACAAPGGKSAHLLELSGGAMDLTCLDSDPDRLSAVAGNLKRLRLDATLLAGDASKPKEWWDNVAYDAILLDAPCSATGVIRRHPDIKLLRRSSDVRRLADLQGRILRALWPMLAPGGRLLYVTCSVLAAENDKIVSAFIEETDDVREYSVLQNNNIHDVMRTRACGFQILPGTAGLDGFYFAGLEKVS